MVVQQQQHTQTVCLGLLKEVVVGRERVTSGDKGQLSDADDSQPSYFSTRESGKNTMTVRAQEAPHAHRRY